MEKSKKRVNIRMSGLGGQGVVTSAHVLAMAANRDGLFSISNPFFGAEKRMAPAESYCRVGPERIYDRGELVYPDIIVVYHPQVITLQKSYTAPFYSGIKKNGLLIINANAELLTDEEKQELAELNVSVYTFDATAVAIEVAGTELSSNMALIGAICGISKVVSLDGLDGAIQERFGKKYVASGGTATLDEAIKKKFAKKEHLLKKNMDTIRKSYELAEAWAKDHKLAAVA
jgi:pyruvate ferredoxin oxidoreductase gamma subunit